MAETQNLEFAGKAELENGDGYYCSVMPNLPCNEYYSSVSTLACIMEARYKHDFRERITFEPPKEVINIRPDLVPIVKYHALSDEEKAEFEKGVLKWLESDSNQGD